eukprot:1274166-Pyramimonas_sp.AAC.1
MAVLFAIGLDGYLGARTRGVRRYLGGEFNSPVVKWHLKGVMDNSHLWHFFSVRKYLGEQLNPPVAEWNQIR